MPNWWRKAGNHGHGYQLNNERDMMAFFDPLINHPESGTLLRARSEMDEMFKGWFQEAPVWNAYWLNLWALFTVKNRSWVIMPPKVTSVSAGMTGTWSAVCEA